MTTITEQLITMLDDILNSKKPFTQQELEHGKWLLKKLQREKQFYREDTRTIEIYFPRGVNVSDTNFHAIVETVGKICDEYVGHHPGRVMWPAGMGSKITYMPMTREEELAGKHVEFDPNVLSIECCEREDYEWKCKKCGMEQGNHKGCIVDPPAGDCDFEPADTKHGKENTNGAEE